MCMSVQHRLAQRAGMGGYQCRYICEYVCVPIIHTRRKWRVVCASIGGVHSAWSNMHTEFMHMCLYVCMCVQTCVCVCARECVQMCVCMCVCVCVCVCVCAPHVLTGLTVQCLPLRPLHPSPPPHWWPEAAKSSFQYQTLPHVNCKTTGKVSLSVACATA